MTIDPAHVANVQRARELYRDNLGPDQASADWHAAKRHARHLVAATLRASDYLHDIGKALAESAGHTLVLRQLLAPPMSQDQFALVAKGWSKGAENSGRPMAKATADIIAQVVAERIDRGLAGWVATGRRPHRAEIVVLIHVASTLMATLTVATARRLRLAFEQEYAVELLLEAKGWTRLPSKLIDTRAAVPPGSFMRKTRFATDTTAPQEVDIACGLQRSYVLAMECKVTNDETNSVKRVNDVLKKAAAWKAHWGSFVMTAALLQGVVAAKDVQRLTDAGVHVFWSHDLAAFERWLDAQMA